MKLEEQVITIEQAARLKELGVELESVFNYAFMGDVTRLIWGNSDQLGGKYTHWLKIPAYTVAELGEMLPNTISKNSRTYYFASNKGVKSPTGQQWECCYALPDDIFKPELALLFGPTEAAARAAMLIHLLEEGIITPAK